MGKHTGSASLGRRLSSSPSSCSSCSSSCSTASSALARFLLCCPVLVLCLCLFGSAGVGFVHAVGIDGDGVDGNGTAEDMHVLKNVFFTAKVPSLQYTPVLYPTVETIAFKQQEDLQDVDVANDTRLVVLGGVRWDSQPDDLRLHGVQIYSVRTWRHCEVVSPGPNLRNLTLQTSVRFEGDQGIYIFGGLMPTGPNTKNSFRNIEQLWRLKVYPNFPRRQFECSWEEVPTENTPPARHAHTLAKVSDHQFIIHGGCARHHLEGQDAGVVRLFFICDESLDDVHLFDMDTKRWTQLEVQNSPPLIYHQMGLLTSAPLVYLFGGYSAEAELNPRMYRALLPNIITNSTALTFEEVTMTPQVITHVRGAIDPVAQTTATYFYTPDHGSPFDQQRKLVSLQGTFQDPGTFQQFEWQAANVFRSAAHPWSAAQTLRSFALGGGLGFVEVEHGRGVLFGIFINDATGEPAPVWEVFDYNSNVMSFSVQSAVTQPTHRSDAAVLRLPNNRYLVAGGASPGPDDSLWLLSPDDLEVHDPKEQPTFKTLPSPREDAFARFGFCILLMPNNEEVLVAGGTTDITSPHLKDYFYNITSVTTKRLGAGNPNYQDLHVHGPRCFRRGDTVFSVGGIPTRSATDEEPAVPPLVHMWSREEGWRGCNGSRFPFQPGYSIAELLQTDDNGTEEVILFSGFNALDTVPQGSDRMLAIGCGALPWEACTCDHITVREITPTPKQKRRPSHENFLLAVDEDLWPARRSSACSAQAGPSRLLMQGGHLNGQPWQSTWMLEVNNGRMVWSELGDISRVPIIAADATYGASCFMHNDMFVVVGGSGKGRLFSSIQTVRPTCNTGYGVEKGAFIDGNCKPCDHTSYRGDFFIDTCYQCPEGTQRPADGDAMGFRSTSCQQCTSSFCVHARHQQVDFKNGKPTCVCHCRTFYFGHRCDRLDTQRVLLVTLLPLAIMLGVLLSGVGYRHFRRLRTTSALQQKLLSEKDSELLELHASWEVNPADLVYHRVIGEGGFGEVWLATWLVRDEPVAVKKLHTALLDQETMASFEGEIRFMKTLRHRNIVFFLGAYASDTESLIVMEYVQKGALCDHIHNKEQSITQAMRVSFMRDAAAGMAYLHGLTPPRIHRDLKSMNLLVTDNWVVKVADFTTAKKMLLQRSGHVSELPKMPHSSASVYVDKTTTYGTLQWSAPEVLAGEPYTLAVDVYSFGIVMWETLARAYPYATYSFFGQLREAVVGRKERPPLPEAFRALLDEADAEALGAGPGEGGGASNGLGETLFGDATHGNDNGGAGDGEGSSSSSSSSGDKRKGRAARSPAPNAPNTTGKRSNTVSTVAATSTTTTTTTTTSTRASSGGRQGDDDTGVDVAYMRLMRRCWVQEPSKRPSFVEVETELQVLADRMAVPRQWSDASEVTVNVSAARGRGATMA